MSIETRTPVLTRTLAQEGDADADLGAAGGEGVDGRIGETTKTTHICSVVLILVSLISAQPL